MLLAVCLKQVASRESPVRPDAGSGWIRHDDVTWTLNEPDTYALEEALRLKQKHGGEVIAISVGPDRVATALRDALARGADRAIHVRDELTESEADPRQTAAALAHALRDEHPDLVLTGLQSDDQGFGQVGVILAERLSMAHATIVVQTEIAGGAVRVKRELEGSWFQWVTLPMPALLTIQSGINQPRYTTLRGIMAAKKKTIETVAVPDGTAALQPAGVQRVIAISVPARQKQTRLIGGTPAEAAAELAKVLRRLT
jgi:electron transfer flavoprotein beta subunit